MTRRRKLVALVLPSLYVCLFYRMWTLLLDTKKKQKLLCHAPVVNVKFEITRFSSFSGQHVNNFLLSESLQQIWKPLVPLQIWNLVYGRRCCHIGIFHLGWALCTVYTGIWSRVGSILQGRPYTLVEKFIMQWWTLHRLNPATREADSSILITRFRSLWRWDIQVHDESKLYELYLRCHKL